MRIEKWKNWYQVRNNDGYVVAQFLSRGAALAAIGGGYYSGWLYNNASWQ